MVYPQEHRFMGRPPLFNAAIQIPQGEMMEWCPDRELNQETLALNRLVHYPPRDTSSVLITFPLSM